MFKFLVRFDLRILAVCEDSKVSRVNYHFCRKNNSFNILYRFFFVVKRNRRIFAAQNSPEGQKQRRAAAIARSYHSRAFLMPIRRLEVSEEIHAQRC